MSLKDLTVLQKDEYYCISVLRAKQVKEKVYTTILIRASKIKESEERKIKRRKKLNLYKPNDSNKIKFTRIVRNVICIHRK